MLPPRSSIWILSLWMLACGGKATSDAPTTGSAAGGNGSGGSSAGEPGDTCESFDDEQGHHLSVVLVNQTSAPIYLGPFTQGDCSPPPPLFSIQQDGQHLVLVEHCRATCAQMRDHGYSGCPAICWQPETIELAPGEGHSVDWSGLILTERTLPVECVQAEHGPQTDEACRQRTVIPEGTATFAARAGTEPICQDWVEPEECGSCSPSEAGGCVHYGSHVAGETLRAEVEVDLGPAHGLGASEAEPGANSPIEIVFTD